jgi:hypothetical protein
MKLDGSEVKQNSSSIIMYSYSLYGRVKGTKVQGTYPGDVVNQFFIR